MASVLITGANGFTGRILVEILKDSKWEVIPMTHRETGWENEMVVDFTNKNFSALLHELPPVDAVVHLGARTGWDGGTRKDLFTPNISATALLVDWALKKSAHFIFSSAALVCGPRRTHITADCAPEPTHDYLYCKWLGEEIIRSSSIRHTILRIGGIFGSGGPSHLGLNQAIDRALSGRPPILHGDGKMKRNYIYVRDLCRMIAFCLDSRLEGTHLAAGSTTNTMEEMLTVTCKILLPGSRPEHRPSGKTGDQIIDSSPQLPGGRTFREALEDIKMRTTDRKGSTT